MTPINSALPTQLSAKNDPWAVCKSDDSTTSSSHADAVDPWAGRTEDTYAGSSTATSTAADPWAGATTSSTATTTAADPWAGAAASSSSGDDAATQTCTAADPWAGAAETKLSDGAATQTSTPADPWAGASAHASATATVSTKTGTSDEQPPTRDADADGGGLFTTGGAAQPTAKHTVFGRIVSENFDKLDSDGDGFIDKSEINAAMKDKNVKGELAAAVSTLKDKYSTLEDMSNDEIGWENDGVTRDDIEEYEKESLDGDKDAQKIDGRYVDAAYKIRDTSRALFPEGAPDAKAVEQGDISDCWFVSAVASKTAMNPDAVRRMITSNGNDTYTVQLGDDKITVDAPTDAEIGYGASAGKNGLWMTVAEKAEAKREAQRMSRAMHPFGGDDDDIYDNDYDAIDHGRSIGSGVTDVTGDGTDHDFLTFASYDTTRDKLEETLGDHKVVTAGIRGAVFGKNRRGNGLPMGHAYSVIGYDRSTDRVTVRNPWGSTEPVDDNGRPLDGKDDGVFSMSLEDFDDNFTDVSYEE